MIEHRWQPRVAVEVDVVLVIEEQFFIPGQVRNASRNGLYIDTPVPLASNTYVRVQFRLPAGSRFAVAGLVVHRAAGGAGLMLNVTDATTADCLNKVIERSQRALPPIGEPIAAAPERRRAASYRGRG